MARKYPRIVGLGRATDGAVAPLTALVLIGVIASGGIAFDYARMASVDTELQGAADQAALAAASQLDGKAGACARAANAAVSLLQNETRFANDGSGRAISIALEATCDATGNVRFYKTKDKTTAASNDADARYVEVTVNARRANFALTPIASAFGADLRGTAYAGLGSSVCKVPPLMMCNPAEVPGSGITLTKGIGIRLVAGGSGGAWSPGNFGYLETNLGTGGGANSLEYALGANLPPGDCVSAETVSTKPGLTTSVTDAINARFDIYEAGLTNACTTATCSPALNVRKDVVHEAFANAAGGNNVNSCKLQGNNNWDPPKVPYEPTSKTLPYSGTTPTNMGLPRDVCHAVSDAGDCNRDPEDRIGDGIWDRDLYFQVNHPDLTDWKATLQTATGMTATQVANISRYDVYLWEIATAGRLGPGTTADANGNKSYSAPMCGIGVAPSAAQPDRRKATVAVVDCVAAGINGAATNVPVNKWLEIFFVEPSIARSRTKAADIYVEIVKEATTVSDGSNLQVVRRDIPYLIE